MKLHFSKRERVISVILLVTFGGYIVYTLGDQLFWSKWQRLDGQKNAAVRLLKQKTEMFVRQSSGAEDRRRILEMYSQNQSDERVRSEMLVFLQQISSKSNVRMIDMKPDVIRREKLLKEFPVNITLEGKFVDIMRFFHAIEFHATGFQIQEFRFLQNYGATSFLRCQTTVARVFFSQN